MDVLAYFARLALDLIENLGVERLAQILEPQLLGLLCMRGVTGGNAIGKFVLIGDHKQLPAVVLQSSEQSEVYDEGLRTIGLCNLKDSLFERLYRNAMKQRSACCLQPSTGDSQSSVAGSPFSALRSLDILCRQGT